LPLSLSDLHFYLRAFESLNSNRQTPGGHNVLAGLHDYLSPLSGKVLGFVGGIHGLLKKQVNSEFKHLKSNADMRRYRSSVLDLVSLLIHS
jgi:hypothetical protein